MYNVKNLMEYSINISSEEFHKKYHSDLTFEECFKLYYPIRVTDIAAIESRKKLCSNKKK